MNRTRQRPVVARMLVSSGSTRHGLLKTGTRMHGSTPAHPSEEGRPRSRWDPSAPPGAKSCSVWSSGQAGRGVTKPDSASRQTEHSLQYSGSELVTQPLFRVCHGKKEG